MSVINNSQNVKPTKLQIEGQNGRENSQEWHVFAMTDHSISYQGPLLWKRLHHFVA